MAIKDPYSRIGYLAWHLQQAMGKRAVHALASLDLTLTQHSTLVALAIEPNLSSAELARRAGVTAPSMGKAVVDLEERGLVVRTPHPTHGRVIQLAATEEGKRLARLSQGLLDPVEEGALAQLDPEERERLRALLRQVVGRLTPAAIPAPPAGRRRGGRRR